MKTIIAVTLSVVMSSLLMGCTSRRLVEASPNLDTVVNRPLEVVGFVRLNEYYESVLPCTEINFINKYVGTERNKVYIDNVIDIHRQEIEETVSLGFITFGKKYRCTYWGLGVEYRVDSEE